MPTLYKDGEAVLCDSDQVDALLGAGYSLEQAPAKKLSAAEQKAADKAAATAGDAGQEGYLNGLDS